MEKNDIAFIMRTLAVQRLEDYKADGKENIFKWLLELYEDCKKFMEDQSDLRLKSKVIETFNEFIDYVYFMRTVGEDDITIANYREKQNEAKKPPAPTGALVVKEGTDGQAKLVMQRGGAREGAGRKKSGKESRTVRVALDSIVWQTIEGIKEIEDISTMSEMLAILIERGLDNNGE